MALKEIIRVIKHQRQHEIEEMAGNGVFAKRFEICQQLMRN